MLPQGSSLDNLKYIYDELSKRREFKKSEQSVPTLQPKKSMTEHLALVTAVVMEITQYLQQFNNQFFKDFISQVKFVWMCESIPLQLKALKLVPLVDLKKKVEHLIKNIKIAIKKKEIEDQIIDFQELLLLELSKWFKYSFFTWVNSPECDMCGCKETKLVENRNTLKNGCHREEVS